MKYAVTGITPLNINVNINYQNITHLFEFGPNYVIGRDAKFDEEKYAISSFSVKSVLLTQAQGV